MKTSLIKNINRVIKTLDGFLKFDDGTLIINPRFQKKIENGNGFAVGHRFEGVGTDESIYMYFENPINSGVKAYIISILVTSTAKAYIDIFRNNTVLNPGITLKPINLNFASNNTSKIHVEYGGTYSLGVRTLDDLNPGGVIATAIGWVSDVGESVVVNPGSNFVIKITNKSNVTEDIAIRIIWWEE